MFRAFYLMHAGRQAGRQALAFKTLLGLTRRQVLFSNWDCKIIVKWLSRKQENKVRNTKMINYHSPPPPKKYVHNMILLLVLGSKQVKSLISRITMAFKESKKKKKQKKNKNKNQKLCVKTSATATLFINATYLPPIFDCTKRTLTDWLTVRQLWQCFYYSFVCVCVFIL